METITLETLRTNRANPESIRKQLQYAINRGLAGDRARAWKFVPPIPVGVIPERTDSNEWHYKVVLQFEFIGKANEGVIASKLSKLKEIIGKAATSKGGWVIENPEGTTLTTLDNVNVIADISLDRAKHFDHIYGLGSQINIMHDALTLAKETGYEKRMHCVLYGDPGCGKSEILSSFKHMVGEEGHLALDGTSTTAAGAIRTLLDLDVLPASVFIEEIEKAQDVPFFWLLGALDIRAEIRKTNFHGSKHRKMPFVCFATVNDIDLFRSRNQGAMASRFPHQLYCPRPTKKIVERILLREVNSIAKYKKIDPAWIGPAIDYCFDEEKNQDPRRAIAVCLTGQNRLLDGSFQKDMRKCSYKAENK